MLVTSATADEAALLATLVTSATTDEMALSTMLVTALKAEVATLVTSATTDEAAAAEDAWDSVSFLVLRFNDEKNVENVGIATTDETAKLGVVVSTDKELSDMLSGPPRLTLVGSDFRPDSELAETGSETTKLIGGTAIELVIAERMEILLNVAATGTGILTETEIDRLLVVTTTTWEVTEANAALAEELVLMLLSTALLPTWEPVAAVADTDESVEVIVLGLKTGWI